MILAMANGRTPFAVLLFSDRALLLLAMAPAATYDP